MDCEIIGITQLHTPEESSNSTGENLGLIKPLAGLGLCHPSEKGHLGAP